MEEDRKIWPMQLHEYIQVTNPSLSINLHMLFVNNEYNSHVVFYGKTKSFIRVRSQATLSFLCFLLFYL